MHFGENVSSEFDHSLTIPLEEHSVLKYRLFKPVNRRKDLDKKEKILFGNRYIITYI